MGFKADRPSERLDHPSAVYRCMAVEWVSNSKPAAVDSLNDASTRYLVKPSDPPVSITAYQLLQNDRHYTSFPVSNGILRQPQL